MVRVIFDDLCICGAKRLDDPSSVDPPLGHLEQRVLTVEHAIEARAYFLHVPGCLPIRIGQVHLPHDLLRQPNWVADLLKLILL